jgi:hypothetical protein
VLRRLVRLGLWLALLGGIAVAVTRARRAATPPASAPAPDRGPWPPLAEPTPGWVAPADGTCPPGYPVKAKLGSKIYHLPGMANYERTQPDRCYAGAAEAEADGLRPAKR